MKMKKLLAGIAAAAVTVSAMTAVTASAVTNGDKVDFEDGDCSFVYINNLGDGADATVSVEDYNGSKQLKVDVADKTAVPKVWFYLDGIMARENAVNIKKITMDVTFVAKESGQTVGYVGGVIGAAGGFDPNDDNDHGQANPGWSQGTEYTGGAYDPDVPVEITIERKFLLPKDMYTMEGKNPFFGLMRWPAAEDNQAPYYIYFDNIQFFDGDGNTIAVGGGTTVSAPAPAASESAPASDGDTAPAQTGNTSAAAMLAVMAAAGIAGAAAKKRK